MLYLIILILALLSLGMGFWALKQDRIAFYSFDQDQAKHNHLLAQGLGVSLLFAGTVLAFILVMVYLFHLPAYLLVIVAGFIYLTVLVKLVQMKGSLK
ncbi:MULTISPECIES: hypothetical protein [Aerococcus]|uniref:DUF3784 domain-containing protein n=1 Tax=Aerococcus sanguinicola TaxID=119206 RepID=A0A5N1GJJ7_9LACT|nr:MULTISPECIES: hypothetical protein [Aerococcus]KAA9301153.1 hypothetical protein F6I03_04600 [Aerococcus sanguinicola]MDK6679143.1 hypothetical protein [Aerococcus sp. UMB8608]MDK6687172.1 hypothetical protein [Aerococcus sp. UMB8623]MDK6941128.1 hypothetical protein [Aerococcus sp. UMB8487]OFK13531.1 hypothetical protein HMPREF2829_05750 [Aerococcus sp. HMSC072A12]